MNELEFLKDTVRYYSEDVNRRCCDDSGFCFYDPAALRKEDISEGCAIGRHMTAAQKKEAYLGMTVNALPSSLIPESLKSFSMDFLMRVQSLHDYPSNWTSTGLSDFGVEAYNSIKSQFCQ